MLFPNVTIALERLGRTQVFLAETLAISQPTLSRKLSGLSDLAPHEKARIAEALGFTEEWLFAPISIPREAARETAMRAPAETARLDLPRRVTTQNWTGDIRFDSLPPKFLRTANRWRHIEIDVWPNPIKLLDEVREAHGREMYRLGCEFVIATLRKRFGTKPGFFCRFTFYPAALTGIEPSPRPGEDVLCWGETKDVLHPLREGV